MHMYIHFSYCACANYISKGPFCASSAVGYWNEGKYLHTWVAFIMLLGIPALQFHVICRPTNFNLEICLNLESCQ